MLNWGYLHRIGNALNPCKQHAIVNKASIIWFLFYHLANISHDNDVKHRHFAPEKCVCQRRTCTNICFRQLFVICHSCWFSMWSLINFLLMCIQHCPNCKNFTHFQFVWTVWNFWIRTKTVGTLALYSFMEWIIFISLGQFGYRENSAVRVVRPADSG